VTAPTAPGVRRDFELPEDDAEALVARGLQWETVVHIEGDTRVFWVIIPDYPIPPGYVDRGIPSSPVNRALVAVRVTGYPGGALDMVYVHPPLHRADGRPVPNLSDIAIAGRPFQQWSRHYSAANPFRVGIDTLATHLMLADEWFAREFR